MTTKVENERAWNLFRAAAWTGAGVVMVLPAVAMRFTNEVNWTGSDFLFAGALIGGTGLLFEFALRLSGSSAYRLGAVLGLGTAFLTIWVNLAVGMVGDEDNPVNLLFVGVLAIALFGAILGRFEAGGMVRAASAAALAQALAAVVAVSLAPDVRGAIFSFLFAAPWALSAALFRKASVA